MANQEQLKLLLDASRQQHISQWNDWRKKHYDILPDLSDANLVDADLSGANLSGTNLFGLDFSGADIYPSNLSGADFRKANLSGADLCGANLSGANFFGVDLSGQSFFKANLSGADLRKANLSGTKFSDANLSGANLSGADLRKANFEGATLENTHFTSREVLNKLKIPLSREQLAGAIFTDEEKFFQDEKKRQDFFSEENPCLAIRFKDESPWLPSDLGFLLLALHAGYVRLVYLATTEEQDKEVIGAALRGGCNLDVSQEIGIQSIESGSLKIKIGPLNPKAATVAISIVALIGLADGVTLTIEQASTAYKNYNQGELFAAQTEYIKNMTLPAPLPPAIQKDIEDQVRNKLNSLAPTILSKLTDNATVRNSPELFTEAVEELSKVAPRLVSQGKSVPEIELPKMSGTDKDK